LEDYSSTDDENNDDLEDLPEKNEYEDEDEDEYDEDKLTEESYRTTYETDPEDLSSLEAAEMADDYEG
jgi:hypothetical protein